MEKQYFNIQPIREIGSYQVDDISDEMLKEINGLKINGPLRQLTKDEIYVRSMFCIGESPTTKNSIHPEREVNGKEILVLSKLAKLLPGAPMMEGHRQDRVPWARIFKAEVQEEPRDKEKVIKASYYFLSGVDKYDTIAREIDAGIRSEGSISYFFKQAACSICHKAMDRISFFGTAITIPKCDHKIGEKYDVNGKEQVCYWYPVPGSIQAVAELSHVYRGAYEKTKAAANISAMQESYSADEIEGAKELQGMIDGDPKDRVGEKNKDDDLVACKACQKEFDYTKEPEAACGVVKCPGCGKFVNQEGEVKEEPSDNAFRLFDDLAGPVKPKKSGIVNNEFFEKEDFRDLEGDFLVEPKYDGVWMEMHRDGEKVEIFTDEGNEHSEKFPGIVADAQAERGDRFLIIGEMVKMRGRQRLGHDEVSAYIHAKGPFEDQAFRFKVFDIVIANGKDLREQSLTDRRKELDSVISNTDQIHKTKFKKAEGGDDLVKAIGELATREGSMIKNIEGKYNKEAEADLYKWKRQFEVDAKVTEKELKEGGGFVYTCEVGRGDEAQEIGKTFATSVKAEKGDIIRVSVDKVTEQEDGTFTWFAPKVVSMRDDKDEPDPISTLKKIAVKKGVGEKDSLTGNIITLGEIVPKLLAFERDYPIFICGGIVEHGYTPNDVDLIVKKDLNDQERLDLVNRFDESLRERIDVCVDMEGPAGPWIELTPEASERYTRGWKFAKKWVLQKHWWGNKVHWDLRFGAPKTPRMWGWTCFTEPSKTAGGKKVRCQEKKYHDPKWMEFEGPIKPGEVGNPTKNLTAHMKIVDKGSYNFIRREPKFLEVILEDGKKWKGRYLFREIEIKGAQKILSENKVEGDEVGVKSEKIWIMWKPKDQTPSKEGGKVNKIAWNMVGGTLTCWETEEIDEELTQTSAT